MTDRENLAEEKLVELLKEIGMLEIEDCLYTAEYLIAHGVTVREPKKPLTVEELMNPPKVVYVECTFFVDMHVGLPDRICRNPPCLGIQFVDAFENFILDKYGKTWRCWAERPTEEERKAAEWKE